MSKHGMNFYETDTSEYFEATKGPRGNLRQSGSWRSGSDRNSDTRSETQTETFFDTYIQPCLCEFTGSVMLILIGALVVRTDNILAIACGHGFILVAICVAFGPISGAHVNPAVTLGALIGGHTTYVIAGLYVACQILGSIVGGLLVRVTVDYKPIRFDDATGSEDPTKSVYERIGGGGPSVAGGMSLFAAMLTEAELTFMLVLVVLMSTAPYRDTTIAPIAIGLTLAACIIAGGASTGAALNPVRALGPSIAYMGMQQTWNNHWVYWLGPMIGGCLAGLFFKTLMGPYNMRLLC